MAATKYEGINGTRWVYHLSPKDIAHLMILFKTEFSDLEEEELIEEVENYLDLSDFVTQDEEE